MEHNRSSQLTTTAFKKLHNISTATLTTQLINRGFHNTFLQLTPMIPQKQMVGYAFTLRYVPMREDLTDTQYDNSVNVQRLAVETVAADDVLIIDARSDVRAALLRPHFSHAHSGARRGRAGNRWRTARYARLQTARNAILLQGSPRHHFICHPSSVGNECANWLCGRAHHAG